MGNVAWQEAYINMSKYSSGIDYGSLSARAILIDLSNGKEVATSEFVYPHAVMPRDFFRGITLDKTAALQHPQDYLDALQNTLKELITETDADIDAYGNKVSSGWLLPKLLEILHKNLELYQETDRFVEAGDWLVWQITGQNAGGVIPTGTKAGEISEYGAKLTGLKPGTAVAAPIIDAHAAMPAAGIAVRIIKHR